MTRANEPIDGRIAHVVHASLIRPVLIAGAEPSIVVLESCIVFALLFVVGIHIVTLLLAAFWLLVVHSSMVRVAKVEPSMTALYIRSVAGRDYYTAHGRVHDPALDTRPSIPVLH